MQYIDSPPPQAPQGAGKYHGAIAQGYDAKRESDPKWVIEQRLIEGMLSDLPAGSAILDCPVGTGRFLPFYVDKGFKFIGADLSGDMLIQSALKLGATQADIQAWIDASAKAQRILALNLDDDRGSLVQGDIRAIGLKDKSVEAAVACRITRWLSPDDCQVMMRELQRVAKRRIIITARIANHVHARSRELFESALAPDWKLVESAAGYITDYRVIRFARGA